MRVEKKMDPVATDSSKKVSAIVPNYNYADFIIERIDSIINQTYPVSELIILDDASTDDSVSIIEGKIKDINKTRPEIKTVFIKNDKNSGGSVFSQWQKGVKVATGDYFWIAEADDSCDVRFLETAVKKFSQDDDIRLFFSDSCRINQDGKFLSKTCTDWADMWKCGHWSKDYIAQGEDEIINYLSGQIYIMNVSSVVWKNEKRCLDIFKEAERFKIAGDWYIYSRIMEEGKVAYSAKPYNYYRKHDKGSVSTVINRLKEYQEVVFVQDRIRDKYYLDEEKIKWQMQRRKFMGYSGNSKNNGTKGRIAWFVPDFPEKGAGGHRTIFQNINRLVEEGYKCDMYVSSPEHAVTLFNRINAGYCDFKADVFSGFDMLDVKYDMIFATSWDTVEAVSKTNIKKKMYFIQDFEPWFFPMGTEYLKAENTYRKGLKGVSIGNWLANKIKKEFGTEMACFDFCADLNIYADKNQKREDAICLIFQPHKTRRCCDIALKALQIVQKKYPKTKIYLYGSAKRVIKHLDAQHLGTISPEECNDLYNKCMIGVSMSSSNPSRIPFEMMAAGLPVVDLYRENNVYDLPEDGCLLAEGSPEAIATTIIKLLEDKKLREKLGKEGNAFMQNYPLERGFDQFVKIVNNEFEGKESFGSKRYEKRYTKDAITPSTESIKISNGIKKDAYCANVAVSEVAKVGSRAIVKRVRNKIRRTAYNFYRKIK